MRVTLGIPIVTRSVLRGCLWIATAAAVKRSGRRKSGQILVFQPTHETRKHGKDRFAWGLQSWFKMILHLSGILP
jgi:hypothetical protein